MPKFTVYLRSTALIPMVVECDRADMAGLIARDVYCESNDPDKDFGTLSFDLIVDSIDDADGDAVLSVANEDEDDNPFDLESPEGRAWEAKQEN